MADGPVRPHPAGAVVAVRAVPGASRAAVMGMRGDELRIRVCSPPVDGRANDELRSVLADALSLRPRDVELVSGHTARSKLLSVPLTPADTLARLAPWIGISEVPER
jgi:hypothetical protein